MPKASDFEYHGLSVEHADNWNALDFNNRQGKYAKQSDQGDADNGLQPVKGMVSNRSRRVHNEQASPELQEETARIARQKWRDMGISNNQITDS